MKVDLVIKNIGELITMQGPQRPWLKKDIESLTRIEDGVVIIKDDKILDAGEKTLLSDYDISEDTEVIDAKGKLVTPGLVDSHVHLIFAGWRENELALTLKGYEYIDILKQGGGILSTVKKTREATEDELYAHVYKLLDNMLEYGTTTSEAKSGYGLELETELKSLRVIKKLDENHAVDLVPTFLGAHAVPPEYKDRSDEYTDYVINEMLPAVAEENLAEFCDVFCDEGVFSVEQARKILQRAKELNMKLKIHADELASLGGAELSAELGATTAEHLLKITDRGIEEMAKSGVIATLLPGTPFYLMLEEYADARKMIDNNLAVSIATDLNPGTSATESLQIIMNLASYMMKMTPEEIITAVTINAAYGVGRGDSVGSLSKGKLADLVIWNADNIEFLSYHFGVNLVDKVVKKGKLVVNNSKIIQK
ncbi:Imidazolonepropionase [Peptoniphilus sp. ING2-D1G]|nr:Imidazolonepropionase [Peptoniphilus sp. ING2-D1G]